MAPNAVSSMVLNRDWASESMQPALHGAQVVQRERRVHLRHRVAERASSAAALAASAARTASVSVRSVQVHAAAGAWSIGR